VNSYATPRQLLQGSGGCQTRSLATLRYPSQHVGFGDGLGTRGLCGTNRTTACAGRWGLGDGTAGQITAFKLHGQGGNLGFTDGHCEWRKTPDGPMAAADCTRLFGDPNAP
jgi:prepilin-type processing-associated H-X9-DG protein